MPSFTLIANRPLTTGSRGPTQFAIVTRDGSMKYAAPYAPLEVDYSGFAWTYSQGDRPGRTPISTPSSKQLRVITMELMIVKRTAAALGNGASLENAEPIEDQLSALRSMADSVQPLTVEYGTQCQGLWVMTDLTFKSIARSPTTNQITRATANLEFTEYSPYAFYIAPPPPPAVGGGGGGGGGGAAGARKAKKYKVKKGDTLARIAKKVYGSSKKKNIQKLIKANPPSKIKKLKPGTTIKVPRPKKKK